MLDYVQESRRAGRDRLDSKAVVVIRLSKFGDLGDRVDNRLVRSFVESIRCKRIVLDGYLDSRSDRIGYKDREKEYKVYIKVRAVVVPVEAVTESKEASR